MANSDHVRVAEAELAVSKRAKLLGELLDTGEPTTEARTLLADLRRAVKRAQQQKLGEHSLTGSAGPQRQG